MISALIYIVSAELVGALSALISDIKNANYIKSPLTPPPYIFIVVWVILYALMGYSAYLISSEKSSPYKRKALVFYYLQIVINFIWSIIFFRLQLFKLAFYVIIVLIVLVSLMIIFMYKVNKKAAVINLPYLLWLIFASVLAFETMKINA